MLPLSKESESSRRRDDAVRSERVARNKALYKIESMDNSEPGEGEGRGGSSSFVERR